MDPDATLTRIRTLVLVMNSTGEDFDWQWHGEQLAEAVEDLDGWLSHGGMPPAAWADN